MCNILSHFELACYAAATASCYTQEAIDVFSPSSTTVVLKLLHAETP